MGEAVKDIIKGAQAARGTFGPACMTCAFGQIGGNCGYFSYSQGLCRSDTRLCGPEGRVWEPKPPRLGLIPWVRRLLWGDAPADPASPLSRGEEGR